MKRKTAFAFLIATFFLASFLLNLKPVTAQSNNDSTHFSDGVTVLCPLNQTYTSDSLIFNYTFECGFGIQYNLTYSIDGVYGGSMPYTLQNADQLHVVYGSFGTIQLPTLSEGSHKLTVSLQTSLNVPGRQYYSDSIYFNIDTNAQNPLSLITHPSETATNPPNNIPLTTPSPTSAPTPASSPNSPSYLPAKPVITESIAPAVVAVVATFLGFCLIAYTKKRSYQRKLMD
jgi:hypothetical protein